MGSEATERAAHQSFPVRRIGLIRTRWLSCEEAPIQGAFVPDAIGTVVVDPQYADGLAGIEGFSHLYLLYYFDRAGEVRMVRRPFMDDHEHGIFSMRHPARPSPIGLTVVRLLRRRGRILRVAGIDVLNGTPLIDIKPYVPRWDGYPDATEGWLHDRPERPKPSGRE